MFNLAVTFIAVALLTPSAVVGQTASDCVNNCTTVALPASGGCTAVTDLTCICASTDFFAAAAACITQDCPDQLASAEAALTAACPSTSGSDSASISDVPTDSSSSSGAVVTPGGSTTRPPVTPVPTTHAPSSTSSHSSSVSSTNTTSTGAGFHTASIASGVTLALFGAAFSLF